MDSDLEKPSQVAGGVGSTFDPLAYATWWRSLTPRQRLDYVLGR